jgi:hypothetical protein
MATCTLYKVLNHCGCCVCATFTNNELNTLVYAYACDACMQHLSLDAFEYYVGLCYDEAVLHTPKILMDRKGWISGATYAHCLHRRNLHRTAFEARARMMIARLAKLQGEKLKAGVNEDGDVSSALPSSSSSDTQRHAPHSQA